MKSVSQCVAEFMRAPEVTRLAAATQKRQVIVLNLLIKGDDGNKPILRPAEPISRLDRGHIDDALYKVNGRLVGSSLNAYQADLRRFGKWLLDRGYTKKDHTAHLRNVKVTTVLAKRKPVANNSAEALISAANAVHPRDGMTAILMIFTGLRESEAVELRWGNVDLEKAVFVVRRAKTRDDHVSFIAPPLLAALKAWKEWVEARNGEIQDDWFVIPARANRYDSTGHHRMNPEWPIVPTRKQTNVNKRVKEWLAAIGEKDLRGRASHTLRRTAANLVRSQPGADIRTAQTLLGHKTASMTENYLDVDKAKEDLMNVVRNWNFNLA